MSARLFALPVIAALFTASNACGLICPFPLNLLPFCLHKDSQVMTPHGHLRVDQIKAGDKVATQTVGGDAHFVTVLKNVEYKGDFEYTMFDFEDYRSLNVTSNHVMGVKRSFGPGVSVAADVQVGEEMYVKDPSGNLRPTKVVAKKSFRNPTKFNLVTDSGSVIVDGVLTTTICDQGVETLPLGFQEAQKFWVESHEAQLEQWRSEINLA